MPGYQVTQKITFWGKTSFTAPAIESINGDVNSDIYLVWAGNDSAHTLYALRRTTNPVTQTSAKLTGWTSIARPNLSTDQSPDSANALILSWTGQDNRIHFANKLATGGWTQPSASPAPAQSAWAPSMIAFYATALPTHWLAWTGSGTTATKRITVQYTQHYPGWSDANSRTTLVETAMSSPELAYNGDGTTKQLLLAWAGTDSAHHLNVAAITV